MKDKFAELENEFLTTLFFDSPKIDKSLEDKSVANFLETNFEHYDKKLRELLQIIAKDDPEFDETVAYFGISFYNYFTNNWLKGYTPIFSSKFADIIDKLFNYYRKLPPNDIITLTKVLSDLEVKKTCKIVLKKIDEKPESGPPDVDLLAHLSYSCNCNNEGKCKLTNGGKLTVESKVINECMQEKGGIEVKHGFDIANKPDIEKPKLKNALDNLFRFLAIQDKIMGWKYLYCFLPTSHVTAGVIFLYSKKRLDSHYSRFFQILANQLFLPIGLVMATKKAKDDLIKHGTRAAAATIIGRNMSHNIGSHVIYYLSNSFQDSDRNLLNDTLKEFIEECNANKDQSSLEEILERFKIDQDGKLNTFNVIYDRISLFLNYIQGRMDYVALAGTIEPVYGQGLKIKDLIDEFKRNKFLLDGIAASEDVKTIEIKPKNDKNSFNGLVTIPFGEIGKHAFFSILENIIRNSAKHSRDNIKNGELILYYSAKKNNNNGSIDLKIYDELETWEDARKAMHLPKERDKPNTGETAEPTVGPPNEDTELSAIESPLIDDKGSLVHAYMGIKEIKISAAFLR
ncbi:MAG: hypothetical protein P9M03_07955, partial [Candidatus Theseobacter exili]|nr:hypothetical protein [Candidatus Theseobacter exili]